MQAERQQGVSAQVGRLEQGISHARVPEAAGPVPAAQRAAAGPPVARAERPNANDQPTQTSQKQHAR